MHKKERTFLSYLNENMSYLRILPANDYSQRDWCDRHGKRDEYVDVGYDESFVGPAPAVDEQIEWHQPEGEDRGDGGHGYTATKRPNCSTGMNL